MYEFKYVCIHICICICILYTYVYVFIHMYIHVFINIYQDTHAYIYVYVSICGYIYIYIYKYLYTYVYVYIYIYVYRYIHTNTSIHIYVYIYTYSCIFIYIHVRVYTCATSTAAQRQRRTRLWFQRVCRRRSRRSTGVTPPSDVVCLSHSTMFSWIWTNTVSEDFNRFHCLNADHVFLWYHAGWVCDLFTFQCVSRLRSRFSVYHVYVHVSVCIMFTFMLQCVSRLWVQPIADRVQQNLEITTGIFLETFNVVLGVRWELQWVPSYYKVLIRLVCWAMCSHSMCARYNF